jgi:hypothetical protein
MPAFSAALRFNRSFVNRNTRIPTGAKWLLYHRDATRIANAATHQVQVKSINHSLHNEPPTCSPMTYRDRCDRWESHRRPFRCRCHDDVRWRTSRSDATDRWQHFLLRVWSEALVIADEYAPIDGALRRARSTAESHHPNPTNSTARSQQRHQMMHEVDEASDVQHAPTNRFGAEPRWYRESRIPQPRS